MRKIKYVKNPEFINGIKVINSPHLAIDMLNNGIELARFEFGNSMSPKLLSGEYCILKPLKNGEEANVGDAVFCKVNGIVMTHMVLSKKNKDSKVEYLISDTYGNIYGWTSEIYAIAHGTNVLEKEN